MAYKTRELYLDNAATSFPKPPVVMAAMHKYASELGASAGRGEYPRALKTGEMLALCRRNLARIFNAPNPSGIIFTLNATDALNIAIKGVGLRRGDHVVISGMEHNSVVRPLNTLKQRIGISVTRAKCRPDGTADPEAFKAAINRRTRLMACVHGSNVAGSIMPVAAIGAAAKRRGIPFLVDAAQTAGCIPIDVRRMNIDMLAFPGHKSLLGPLGTGGLYIKEGLDLDTLREGGTGSISEREEQPDFLPDRFETGSHNAIGLAGLLASTGYILKRGVTGIMRHERELSDGFMRGARRISGLRIYGPDNPAGRVPVFSVAIAGMSPGELSSELWRRAKIMARHGLHCSPAAHAAIGTYPAGTCRLSFGAFNTSADVESALRALAKISGNG